MKPMHSKPKVIAKGRPKVVVKKAAPKSSKPKPPKATPEQARLAAPITPGSAITNAQLNQNTGAALDLRYGGAEAGLNRDVGLAQATARDTAGWYDAYLREMNTHAANTAGIGQTAVNQLAQSTDAVRNLDSTQASAQSQAAQADAAGRGVATAADLSAMANGASTTRQGILASFGAQQAGVNAANSGYADSLAHVVAPGQKLRAQAQGAQGVRDVRNKLGDLQREKGAYGQTYRTGAISDEARNVLANQALGLNAQKAGTAAVLGTKRIQETHRSTTVRERTAGANRTAADQRAEQARQDRLNSPSAQKTAQQVAYFKKHGRYPPTGNPKTAGPGTGPNGRATPQQMSKAKDDIAKTQATIQRLRRDGATSKTKKDAAGNPAKVKLNDNQIREALILNGVPKDFINTAMDIIKNNGVSRANINALHKRGLTLRDLGLQPSKPVVSKVGPNP